MLRTASGGLRSVSRTPPSVGYICLPSVLPSENSTNEYCTNLLFCQLLSGNLGKNIVTRNGAIAGMGVWYRVIGLALYGVEGVAAGS